MTLVDNRYFSYACSHQIQANDNKDLHEMKNYQSQFDEITRAVGTLKRSLKRNPYVRPSVILQEFNSQIACCKQIANYYEDITSLGQLDALEKQLIKIEADLEKMGRYTSEYSSINRAINRTIKNMPKNIEMKDILLRIRKFNEQISDCKNLAYSHQNIYNKEQLVELEEQLKACNQCLSELWRALPIRNKARYRSVFRISKWFKDAQNQPLLDRIIILTLNSRNIAVLSTEISQLHNLQELNLSMNKLVALPEWMGRLATLRILNLSHNKLKKIPEWISAYTLLRKLDLSYNELDQLPTGICQCVSLENLNLSNNQIKEFPKEILCLRKLKELNISMNQIISIFKVVSELAVFRTVMLTY